MTTVSQPVICSFESRRAEEMEALIRKYGAVPVIAPSMKELPLEENPAAEQRIREMLAGGIQHIVFLTGVGAEALLQLADVRGCQPELIAALKMMTVIARGPKPVAVLHRYGIECDLKAPEPNTWREVLTVMEQSGMSFSGSNLAVQEYGVPNPRFNDALTAKGVHVVPVPVYRWALPDDIGPLNAAIDQVIQAQIDVLMFTSANQVATVLQIAEGRGLRNQFCQAAAQCLVASVGPTCSEMLSDMGFVVGFEASPPKMGPLVRGAVETWTQLRQAEQ